MDSMKELGNYYFELGHAIGSIFFERRQSLGVSRSEMSRYMAPFWTNSAGSAVFWLNRMERYGEWGTFSWDYEAHNRPKITKRLSDYVSALGFSKEQKAQIEQGYRRIDANFAFVDSPVPMFQTKVENPRETDFSVLERLLA